MIVLALDMPERYGFEVNFCCLLVRVWINGLHFASCEAVLTLRRKICKVKLRNLRSKVAKLKNFHLRS